MTAGRPPNLLFLFPDQHCWKIAGCYGNPLAITPNLDRLAARGVVFDEAYCPSPLCVPSRMSLLTGRYPSSQECWTNDDFLASDRPTLAHALGAAGYEPVLIGRLHAMGPDQLHGYVHREVGDHSPNWIGVSRHAMGALADTNDPWPASVERSGPGQSDLAEDARHAAVREALTRKALADWDPEGIRNRMQARRRDKDLMGTWARQMHPQNQYRWEFKPEENWLDATSGPEEGS